MLMAFAALFSSIFELLLFLGAAALIFYGFISDWWQAQRAKHREEFSKTSNVEKIAQVKLVSDSRKDIEQFVTDNAQYLSNQMVAKLVARIESLKIDNFILEDDLLKKRIADLPTEQDIQAEAGIFAKAIIARHK
jgi:predicted membrane protein